jgi:hypothetical protein
MHRDYDSGDSIIQDGVGGRFDHDAFYAFCRWNKIEFDDLCNSIALTIARRFNETAMTYEDADGVANALSRLMIAHVTREADACLPEPAWSIFLAFDAGEYDRGDGTDPVECYTRRLVRQALGEL